jgi:lipoyl(octanoyl) transferase
VEIRELGRVEYREALALQEQLRAERQAGTIGDVLLLLEHDPVYTRGRRTDPREMPIAGNIPVVDVDRGGKLTYHGPGQLVGYPITAVEDVVAFVRAMERVIVQALADEGIEARTRADEGPDYTGVWVEDRKIASIGIHVQRGVTTHGFAVNVDGDLSPWQWIVPCGLPDVQMTSILKETGRADMDAFRARLAAAWSQLLSKS